jgi:hypothetical protein
VRGRDADRPGLEASVRTALEGLVAPNDIGPLDPSLEDVFVLQSAGEGEGDA